VLVRAAQGSSASDAPADRSHRYCWSRS
jgi:hypothetical protein